MIKSRKFSLAKMMMFYGPENILIFYWEILLTAEEYVKTNVFKYTLILILSLKGWFETFF